MLARYCLIAASVVLLGACATSYKGVYYDPATGRAHAAGSDFPNAVVIATIGDAEIRRVNGRRVVIGGGYVWMGGYRGLSPQEDDPWPGRAPWEDRGLEQERNRRQEYTSLKGRAGRYELEVGIYSSTTRVVDFEAREVEISRSVSDDAQRLTPFDTEPGRYWVKILTFVHEGDQGWIPVVVRDGSERIVAAPHERMVGMTTAQAIAALEGRRTLTLKQLLDQALKKPEGRAREPAPAERHYAKGRELYQQRNYPAALKEIDQALALDPQLDAAHVYRGMVLRALGRPGEALEAIERGMRLGREQTQRTEAWFWWPNHHRGLVLLQLGRIGEAIAAFDEEVRLNPTAGAYAARGVAWIMRAEQARRQGSAQDAGAHLRAAVADLEQAARRDAGNPFIWVNKARAHFFLNDLQAACDAVRRACAAGDCRLAREITECGG